jgi:hypothetical protein
MNLLIYDNFVIQSGLTPKEVLHRVAKTIKRDQPSLLFGKRYKDYYGKVEGDKFSMDSVPKSRHAPPFVSHIEGEIESDLEGTRINIRMRPPILMLGAMLLWFGILGLQAISILLKIIGPLSGGEAVPAASWNGFGVLLLIIAISLLIFVGSYQVDAIRSKHFLYQLFDAKSK